MASIYFSRISPIRFRKNVAASDMPQLDDAENGVQYYKGIYPLANGNYKPDWKLGETIIIQIQTDLTGQSRDELELMVYTPTGTTTVSSVDVTPSGWLVNGSLGTVFNYSYTPPTEGEYYFTTYNPDVSGLDLYISDVFKVRPNNMDLVEFKYSDYNNSFDGVFYDTNGLIWQPKAYFTGTQIDGEPNRDLSVYNNDKNIQIITRSSITATIDINLTDITRKHYIQLISILSCSVLYVNNQPVLSTTDIGYNPIEKSDGTNLDFNMVRIEDDNFVKNY